MKKVILLYLLAFTFSVVMYAQTASQMEMARTYEAAEKLLFAKNYGAALHELKRNSNPTNDSLLYLKIKVLENVFATDVNHTRDLDSTLKIFMFKVNRYSFPELKYSEVASINTQFQFFKQRDKNFYDSVSKLNPEKLEELSQLNTRITAYLKDTPNSLYGNELTGMNATWEIKRKKIVDFTANKEILKKVGKACAISIGYSSAGGTLKNEFVGMHEYNDVVGFFNGTYMYGLGEKYSVNASLGGVFFNIYTGSRFKAGLSWNIIEGEYTLFDWSKDTLLSTSSKGSFNKSANTKLKSVKVGTRIGPSFTVLLTRKVAVNFYYNVRPGILFFLDKYYFPSKSGSTTTESSIEPKMVNYNLSHEVGMKFYFFGRLFINPYLQFGNYNWKSNLKGGTSSSESFELRANYKFNYVGIRIGV